MRDDIVTRLRKKLVMETLGDKATYLTLGDCLDAADEIERLRTQVEFAHNILGSQTMVWVFHGSEGWQQTNLQHLREPIHEYWEKYGNSFSSFSEVHNDCECHQPKENNND